MKKRVRKIKHRLHRSNNVHRRERNSLRNFVISIVIALVILVAAVLAVNYFTNGKVFNSVQVGIQKLGGMLGTGGVFSPGDEGTAEKPYQISDCQDLQAMKNNLNAYYVLGNDVDCSETSTWNPGAGGSCSGNLNCDSLDVSTCSYYENNFNGACTVAPFYYCSDGNNELNCADPCIFINNECLGISDQSQYCESASQTDCGSDPYGGCSWYSDKNKCSKMVTPAHCISPIGPYGSCSSINSETYCTSGVGCSWTPGTTTSQGFEPIGDSSSNSFTGNFDGQGHTISNLYINRPNQYYVGLFGQFSGGNVLNVKLTNANIIGHEVVGGLVGNLQPGVIDNSFVAGNIQGHQYIGGLVGSSISGTVSNSYSSAEVSGSTYNVGGLVGHNYGGSITNSYSTGNVVGLLDQIGGIAGDSSGGGIISNCYFSGNIFGRRQLGGIVGFAGTISNSFSTGSVSGSSGTYHVGGIAGQIGSTSGSITNSFWYDRGQGLDCFYDSSGTNNNGCTAKTDITQFYGDVNSKLANLNWDTNIWDLSDPNAYPTLKGFEIAPVLYCGDGMCNNGENPSTCSQDCPASCGDGMCTSGETCINCKWDCGACVANCGNNDCETVDGENCDNCSADCGACVSIPISSCTALQNMNQNLLAHYYLTQDLNCNGMSFTPIGDCNDGTNCHGNNGRGHPFVGIFDGRGHTITGLNINQQYYTGLFGYSYGIIKNVGLIDVVVAGYADLGGLVGLNKNGRIENSFVKATLSGYSYIGGLIGQNQEGGSISNSYFSGSASGTNYIAGLIGVDDRAEISNSFASGTFSGGPRGGLIGLNGAGTIVNSYFNKLDTTNCVGQGSSTGCTIVNNNINSFYLSSNPPISSWDFTNIWQENANALPTLRAQIGAVCSSGMSGSGTIADPCVVTSCVQLQAMKDNLTASYTLGNNISCENLDFSSIGNGCYASSFSGKLEGNHYSINGLNKSLFNYLFGRVSNVHLINVNSNNGAGMVLKNWGGIIENCSADGYVNGGVDSSGWCTALGLDKLCISNPGPTLTVSGTGLLVGINWGGSIKNSYTSGVVNGSVSYSHQIGGLVGFSQGNIINCYSKARVITTINGYNAGGLIGEQGSGIVNNSYATGDVSSSGFSGGLIGVMDGVGNSVISNSFATGNVSGNGNNVGGFAGYGNCNGGSQIINSFWYNDQIKCYWGIGASPASCQKKTSVNEFYDSSNDPLSSWDFTNSWTNIRTDYPKLKWEGFSSCTPNWACTEWVCSGTTKTRTCTDTNNCGVNTGKPSESDSCGTTNPGGGGGGANLETGRLVINTNGIDVSLNTNEVVTKIIDLSNSGTSALGATVSVSSNMKDIVKVDELRFILASGAKKSLNVKITAPATAGVYVGFVSINGRQVSITLNVNSPSSQGNLFDAKVVVDNKTSLLTKGDKLVSYVSLVPLLKTKQDVTLKYYIKDLNGNTVRESSEDLTIEGDTSFEKDFDTTGLSAGDYVLAMELVYATGVATSSSHFVVKAASVSSFYKWLLLGVILLIILIIIIIIIVYRRRKKGINFLRKMTINMRR